MVTLYQSQHPHTERLRPRNANKLLHLACQRRGGFTLIEMMVVVLIIAILSSITAVAVNSAKEKARQTACMSNLRQLGTAIVTYRADNFGRNPGWLSNLYPTYIDDKRVFVCRSDEARGLGRTRPSYLPNEQNTQKYPETVDNQSNDSGRLSLGAEGKILANSYFYEFSAALSEWNIPDPNNPGQNKRARWFEFKEYQLANGDENSDNISYSSSRMPIVRCYHHAKYGKIMAYGSPEARTSKSKTMVPITLNVAYAGNVIISPLWWEGALEPGEQ